MITEIKLTPRRLTLLSDMEISSLDELLNYYPKKYEDLSVTPMTKDYDDNRVVCIGKIYSEVKHQRIRNNLSRIQFMAEVNNEIYTITIFNRDYLNRLLYINKIIKIVGKLDYYRKTILASNIYFDVNDNVVTSYRLVEGLKDKEFKNIVSEGINFVENKCGCIDYLPYSLIEKYRLGNKLDALKKVHFPKNLDDVKKGYRYLKYEELLEFVTTLEISKREIKKEGLIGKNIDIERVKLFIDNLPYKLSNAQKSCVDEILEDLRNSSIMYRLVQGDVGSGKTLVAIIALVACVFSNNQGAFMAPTDLLARQHYKTITTLLKDIDIKAELLVSDISAASKKEIKNKLRNGEIDIVIGTHALIQKDVEFKNLGLAVIDEQHRFGVKQRQVLRSKGEKVDLLLMSATPIPRTLAHTIYGDLDISTIDEFPMGKRDVKTVFIGNKDEDKMISDIKHIVSQGKRVYIVCPLIEGNSKSKKSVLETYKKYEDMFKEYGVGYLHGKLDDEIKTQTLIDFAMGKINVLVSTTVIEVGIDVKEAEAIVIYGANNFGLAQLHQLRGRVGRNGKRGYCYLVSDIEEEESVERLKFMCSSDDGFEISRYDMQKRGVGDRKSVV